MKVEIVVDVYAFDGGNDVQVWNVTGGRNAPSPYPERHEGRYLVTVEVPTKRERLPVIEASATKVSR